MTFFPSRAVAVQMLGFSIYWYGIMYMIAFVLAYLFISKLSRYRNFTLSEDDLSAVMTSGILGVILGGRLGYVLLYDAQFFFAHPSQIIAVWNGGMSSHGGFIGVAIALFFSLRKRKIPVLSFLDSITVPVALGLMLGRVGNFINQELYGTVTTLPWAIAIPGVEGLRHPTQIYAVIKDTCIALVCFLHIRKSSPSIPGITFSIFLMMYGVLRFVVEYFRDQQFPPFELGMLTLTRGQALTIPIFLAGVTLTRWLHRRESA